MRFTDATFAARDALIALVGRSLAPLYPGEAVEPLLADWLAGVPTARILAALPTAPAEPTADALAGVLEAADRGPGQEIRAAIAREFPELRPDRAEALVAYTLTLRELAIDTGDQVEMHRLIGAGVRTTAIAIYQTKAEHLLAVLAGERAYRNPAPADAAMAAATRLRLAGLGASVRHTFAGAGA